jgi:hypothetical protein
MALMRRARIVVVLEVMWAYPGDPPRRWFRINPYNHSGRRLINIIGHTDFTVTNACPDVVYSAKGRGKPDADWLARNLAILKPDVLLVCGRVAQETFKRFMVGGRTQVISMPHPAARTWSKAKIASAQRRVRIALAGRI